MLFMHENTMSFSLLTDEIPTICFNVTMLLFHNEFVTQNEISKYEKAQANREPRRQQKGRSRSIVPCFLESPL